VLTVIATPRDSITDARVYLICTEIDEQRVEAALRGGVDIVQIRLADSADDAAILAAAERLRPVCERLGKPLLLDDRPDLVEAARADGVHLESDRFTPEAARALIGPDRILGWSAGSAERIQQAEDLPVDYISVGPVFNSTTKPDSVAVGHRLVTFASRNTTVPFFAVGGIEPHNAGSVAAAGAQRVAVAAAIETSPDPGRSAAVLRSEVIAPADFIERYRARTEAQNAAARAKLEPLAPGERPWPLQVASALAGLAGIVNLIAYAAGEKINGSRPNAAVILVFSALAIGLAIGMWLRVYVAGLVFMVVLAVLIVMFSLFLIEASNLLGVVVPLIIIGGGGFLFWKLVRVLGRLQAPGSR